jgi:hypothetical protein
MPSDKMLNPDFQYIQGLIDQLDGDSDAFVETLRREQISHLSFSQITTVEFCQYRYYLQYILMKDPDPVPDYFTKGKLFHQVVASHYRQKTDHHDSSRRNAYQLIEGVYQGENQRHLENAFLVHLENCWVNCEIIAVEKPFVMYIGSDLPPCVGVIDLIVKNNGTYILVDHKTGRDFYPQDELQMAIYVQYIKQWFGPVGCEFYYDHYRWVKNLDRIRKPAFQRDGVTLSPDHWQYALTRIREGYGLIERIKRNGECFRCPYHRICY